MKDLNKNQLNIFLGYIVLIIIGTATSVSGIYLIQKITPQPLIIEKTDKPSQYPDYDAIKGKNPDLKIKPIRFTDGCPGGGCVNKVPATKLFDGIKKNYSVKGKISRGYLYIEVAVDYVRPLTTYDDFYFTLNYNGGHLHTDENLLPTPPTDITRYLYDLRSITYSYQQRVYRNVDFLALFQNTRTFNIHTAVSSDRPGRVLKEVSIYYQCEDESDCDIEEIKN